MTLEWWQWIISAVGILGLSPAPWILGLATNRLQFTSTAEANYERRAAEARANYEARAIEIKEHYDELFAVQVERYMEMKESRNGYKEATREERLRADTATQAIAQIRDAVVATNHVLSSITEAAKEASPEGGAEL